MVLSDCSAWDEKSLRTPVANFDFFRYKRNCKNYKDRKHGVEERAPKPHSCGSNSVKIAQNTPTHEERTHDSSGERRRARTMV
jgi:hypothetical protein